MQDLWAKECIEDIESKVPDRKSRGCRLHDLKFRRCKYPKRSFLYLQKASVHNLSELEKKPKSDLSRNKTHND